MKSTITKKSLIVLLLIIFIVTACQSRFAPQAPSSSTKTANGNPTRTLPPTSTVIPTSANTATPTIQPTIAITPSGPASCIVAPILPVVDEKSDQLIPDPSESDWVYGPEDARLTIYEYTDFQCQICANLAMNLREVQLLYPQDVQVVFRYLPLSEEHDKSALAFQAAEAAGLQDKYWQMHDLLFTSQNDWIYLSVREFSAWLSSKAEELDLDEQQFTSDLTSDEIVRHVFEATQASVQTTLTNPPALFFNKLQYQNWVDSSSLINMVEFFKLPDKGFTSCPEMTIDPNKKYTVTFATEKGDIVFELFPKEAPMAVNNFIFLANSNWYDNSPFFRVIPGFLVQGGDPTGSANGRPGFLFTNEVTPMLRFDQPGMLAMTNEGDGTNGSQFFITYTAIPEYDGQFTIFGKVIEGMDVLESLRPRDPYFDRLLLPPDVLISVTIEEE